jgi:DNA-binding NarL/FixJ family response regulator
MRRKIKKRILIYTSHEHHSIEVTMATQILIVDDRAVVRKELRNVLDLIGSVSVIGEAADGWDAIRQTEALKPDIVLMDLEMPGLDGFEATRQIKALHLARTVIVFTIYDTGDNRKKALEAGADAFIVKGTDLGALLDLFEQFSHQQIDLPDAPDGFLKRRKHNEAQQN